MGASEPPDMAAMVGRIARGMVRRAAEGDREALSALAAMAAHVDTATTEAARALHAHGDSWTDVGRELGITRQAARQRFAPPPVVGHNLAEARLGRIP